MLPLHFMNYFGSTDVEDLFATLDYATYEHDIAHIILDNLQFMLSGQRMGMDKFEYQDRVIGRIRQFASDRNVHVTLVIHPRKVDDGEDLNIASVFGGGKATQEADNVFILQNLGKYRRLDVKKNRFDGSVGKQCMGFDVTTKRYFEMTNEEVRNLESKPAETIRDTKRRRMEAFGTLEPQLARLEEELGPATSNPLPNKSQKKITRSSLKAWASHSSVPKPVPTDKTSIPREAFLSDYADPDLERLVIDPVKQTIGDTIRESEGKEELRLEEISFEEDTDVASFMSDSDRMIVNMALDDEIRLQKRKESFKKLKSRLQKPHNDNH